jgi:hypothetical protein
MGRTATAEAAPEAPEPEAALEPKWYPPSIPASLSVPVVAVAMTHEGRYGGQPEHAATVLAAAVDTDTVSLLVTPLHHSPIRAMNVRHMSAVQPFDRWAWRHIGEKARLEAAPGSLTAAPDAEQP